jgi:lysophospholipase L1-like esterase
VKSAILFRFFSAAAFLASVALNVVLVRFAYNYYWLLNDTRLAPFGWQLPAVEPTQLPDQPRIVLIGDSRVGAWPLPKAVATGQISAAFIPMGASGDTTSQVLGRFTDRMSALKAKVIVIQVGINDIKALPLLQGRHDLIVRRCISNISRLVEQAAASSSIVVLTTIIPAGESIPLYRMPFWPKQVDQAVHACNRGIKALASDRVVILDTGLILANPHGRVSRRYQHDFLHLNADGYEALNQSLIKTLVPLLEKQVS